MIYGVTVGNNQLRIVTFPVWIQELIGHLEKNPDVYRKALSKRKLEEMENSSLFAMLKVHLKTSSFC